MKKYSLKGFNCNVLKNLSMRLKNDFKCLTKKLLILCNHFRSRETYCQLFRKGKYKFKFKQKKLEFQMILLSSTIITSNYLKNKHVH